MGTLAGKILFTCGILIVLWGILLPWSGLDWKLYVYEKWIMGWLGLALVLGGAFFIYSGTSAELNRNVKAFIKYMSLSGLAVSTACFFFGSWLQTAVGPLGVALNLAIFLVNRKDRFRSRRSNLVLAILLLVSFLTVIVWNFVATVLVYF